jgi:hypothetical protein
MKITAYAGTVVSRSPTFQGTEVPATLVTIETGGKIECRMVFFLNATTPVLLQGATQHPGDSELSGAWKDPRGWEVSWMIRLAKEAVTGTFKQPHDFGDFVLKKIEQP